MFSRHEEPVKEKIIQWIERLTAERDKDPNNSAAEMDLVQICKIVILSTRKFKTAP